MLALLPVRSARAAEDRGDPAASNAAFGAPRTLFVSVERVSPLVVLEADRTGRGRIDESRTFVGTLGATPTPPPPERLPRLALDYATGGGWTVGGSVYVAHVWTETPALRGDDVGLAPRVGHTFLLGRGAAFWPRLGVSYNAVRTETGSAARLEGTVDGAFAFFPTRDVALTLTPALDVGLASSAPASPASTGRFSVTVGITTGIRDGSDDAGNAPASPRGSVAPARALARAGRATISADRLLPLLDYEKPDGGAAALMSGTNHTFTRDQALYPRFAADFTLASGFTFGTAFAFNLTPWENVQTYATPRDGRLVPGPRANLDLHAFSVGVEPRVGLVRALADDVAIWIRGGVTYEAAALLQQSDGKVAHRLNLSADPELIYFLGSGLGVTVGPVVDLTLVSAGSDAARYPYGLPGGGVLHLGAVAGALVSF